MSLTGGGGGDWPVKRPDITGRRTPDQEGAWKVEGKTLASSSTDPPPKKKHNQPAVDGAGTTFREIFFKPTGISARCRKFKRSMRMRGTDVGMTIMGRKLCILQPVFEHLPPTQFFSLAFGKYTMVPHCI